MSAMEVRPWFAASGALALHALVIAAALSIAGPEAVRVFVRPVQVALLEAPKPKPEPPKAAPPKPEPVKAEAPKPEPPSPEPPKAAPPKPRPVPARAPERTPERAPPAARPMPRRPAPPQRAEPAPSPPPEPARPAVAAVPIETPRPAAITAAPAPATAPLAPRVTEGVPAPPSAAPQVSRQASPSPAPAARTAPRIDASWAGNAPPAYPAMARRLGEEGEVYLDVQVGPAGNVLEVRLKKSSGSSLLDQTAIETVKKWRFTPATVDGKPVAEWYYNWKWVFKLES